jgi:hypothetical protein
MLVIDDIIVATTMLELSDDGSRTYSLAHNVFAERPDVQVVYGEPERPVVWYWPDSVPRSAKVLSYFAVPMVVLTLDHWLSPAPELLVEIAVPDDRPDSYELRRVVTTTSPHARRGPRPGAEDGFPGVGKPGVG